MNDRHVLLRTRGPLRRFKRTLCLLPLSNGF